MWHYRISDLLILKWHEIKILFFSLEAKIKDIGNEIFTLRINFSIFCKIIIQIIVIKNSINNNSNNENNNNRNNNFL